MTVRDLEVREFVEFRGVERADPSVRRALLHSLLSIVQMPNTE